MRKVKVLPVGVVVDWNKSDMVLAVELGVSLPVVARFRKQAGVAPHNRGRRKLVVEKV
jgi:hypothetical protein